MLSLKTVLGVKTSRAILPLLIIKTIQMKVIAKALTMVLTMLKAFRNLRITQL